MANISKSPGGDPERVASERELGHLVEEAIDELPEIYRTVVRTRLHRARVSLRGVIESRVGEHMKAAFTFGHARCDALVAAVLSQLKGEG